MTSPVYDVVIIGGGIVGAACAAECTDAGLRIAIVEAKKGVPAQIGALVAELGELEQRAASAS